MNSNALQRVNRRPLSSQQEAQLRLAQRKLARLRTGNYRWEPGAYIKERLGWEPWSGSQDAPGQQQILDAYVRALRQLHERDDYEKNLVSESSLQYWKPGQVIQNVIRVEAGHTVGKTCLASGIVNHFFDNFTPCVGYCFAPSWEQIHDLLFKEIKAHRRDRGLPGRILDLALDAGDDHFIKGRATNNSQGRGTERVQGQHGRYNLYVLDEAEGVADFVFDAIRSMTSGGISIVLMLANPRTRTSRFHVIAEEPHVVSFRMSCLSHPNVRAGRELVPGAVRRQYVEEMIAAHCEEVAAHEPDNFTFEVEWMPGKILLPDTEFLFRVLGVAPANSSDKTFIPVGRYEAALRRDPIEDRPHVARLGLDVARFGSDSGTLYTRWNGRAYRAAKLTKLETLEYLAVVKTEARKLKAQGVTSLHLRVDGGGGFGGGIVDLARADMEMREMFSEFKVFEVHFNGAVHDAKAYDDWITEATADVAETLKRLAILRPPKELEADLCKREYEWVNRSGVAVKKLVSKEKFRRLLNPERSPDDGDGFVLAIVSDHLVRAKVATSGRVVGLG